MCRFAMLSAGCLLLAMPSAVSSHSVFLVLALVAFVDRAGAAAALCDPAAGAAGADLHVYCCTSCTAPLFMCTAARPVLPQVRE